MGQHGERGSALPRISGSRARPFIAGGRGYDPYDLTTREDRRHRPRRIRRPTWPFPVEARFGLCGCRFPAGAKTSWPFCCAARRWRFPLPCGVGFSFIASLTAGWSNRRAPEFPDPGGSCGHGLTPCANPGRTRCLGRATGVQVDTLDVRPRPGVVFKPFPARHGVWALGHNSSPPPRPRRHRGSVPRYLATSPVFSPCALQVEGGSEFAAEFEPAGRPAARFAPVRAAPGSPPTQPRRRACPPHPHPGVLSAHNRLQFFPTVP